MFTEHSQKMYRFQLSAILLSPFLTLCLLTGSALGFSISSDDMYVTRETGDSVTLSCNYSLSSTSAYLFWYRQYPHKMEYILLRGGKGYSNIFIPNKELPEGKFSSQTSSSSTNLTISGLTESDSALYLCALSDSFGKLIFGQGTHLRVTIGTEQTIPSVYKLKSTSSDEKLPNSVCLITDFPSPNKALEIDGNQVNLTDVAVLDASSDNKWRYSTVTWDNNKNACNGKYDEKDFFAENEPENNEETCSSISIDESFRTNPSLNTLSTTVFGWRVVAVKAIVFNLILSLRLWSS